MNILKEFKEELVQAKLRYSRRDTEEDSAYKISEKVMGNLEILDRLRAYEAMVQVHEREEENYNRACTNELRDEVRFEKGMEFNATAQEANYQNTISLKLNRVWGLLITVSIITEVFFK